jgi:Protein of unknown function (DUF2889)
VRAILPARATIPARSSIEWPDRVSFGAEQHATFDRCFAGKAGGLVGPGLARSAAIPFSSHFAPTPMALPTAVSERQLKHRRSIDVQIYARGDGMWEVDAHLSDVRTRDTRMSTGTLPAGAPIHDMLLRLVIDERFNVVEAGAQTSAMPYPGACDSLGDAYSRLVGLNLLQGFRRAVKERLGGVQGCTHLTELTQVLPTAVVQAFAGEVIDTHGDSESSQQPFQIDRCHALRADGLAVKTYYPRWYRAPTGSTPKSDAPHTSEN